MSWANKYIEGLKAGKTVKFRPHGPSMKGRVEHGQLVTVEPVDEKTVIQKNDIVLCNVKGRQYLHLVWEVVGKDQYRIGNNRGKENGIIGRKSIYGKCVQIED